MKLFNKCVGIPSPWKRPMPHDPNTAWGAPVLRGSIAMLGVLCRQ